MTDHEFLTVEEAARYLRVNPQTVYRLLRCGDCPGFKIGRQWRIRRTDLDAHLCAQDATTPAGSAEATEPGTDAER